MTINFGTRHITILLSPGLMPLIEPFKLGAMQVNLQRQENSPDFALPGEKVLGTGDWPSNHETASNQEDIKDYLRRAYDIR